MLVPARAARLLLLSLALAGGCASPTAREQWSRHFDGGILGGAVASQVQRPDRYIPEGILLATIPASFVYDTDISRYEARRTVDTTTRRSADAMQFLLPGIPVLISGFKWAGGDEGRNFEVVAETLGGIVGLQQLMARTIQRERPDHHDATSFPSGHSTWAFAATTLIVRDMHDPSDTSFHLVDGLMYLPALYNAWERVDINHHWASDVTCGALIGVLWANFVWDAHFKGAQEERPVIFEKDRRGARWAPTMDTIDGRVAFGVKVGV